MKDTTVAMHHATFFVTDYILGTSVKLGACPEGHRVISSVSRFTNQLGPLPSKNKVKEKDGQLYFVSGKMGKKKTDFKVTVAVNFEKVVDQVPEGMIIAVDKAAPGTDKTVYASLGRREGKTHVYGAVEG